MAGEVSDGEAGPPAELANGSTPRPAGRAQPSASLESNPALRPHRVHHDRRPRLRREVAQLYTVDVELERALIVDRIHHRRDMRPSRRADRGEAPDSL